MELGIIGLGRMGANMTERLVLGGHRLIRKKRAGTGADAFPLRPLYVAPGRLVLGKSDRRAAQRIRRSRGEERLVAHGQR